MYQIDSDSDETPIIQDQNSFKTMKVMPEWPQICEILTQMQKQEFKSKQIVQRIDYFRYISLKNKYGSYHYCKKEYQNHKLLQLYQNQLPKIYSRIAQIVINNDFHFPLFRRQQNLQHTFTKQQILYLICSMALCLFPKQIYHSYQIQINFSSHIDFYQIFKSEKYKTKAIMEFIKKQMNNLNIKEEKLTIKRLSVGKKLDDILKENQVKKMCKMTIVCDTASIEDYYGDLKVDFANSYIGGGALSGGCVQEQIMFANHPQMFITQLLCEAMMPNEAIGMIGFKKYNKNQGYSHNTTYAGLQTYEYKYDKQTRAKQYIIAIDALFFIKNSLQQFKVKHVNRQIIKAYCGFKFQDNNLSRLVTGNWGCGAFGGNLRLKFLIQWLACSLTNKQMIYCPFGFSELIKDVQFLKKIANLTITDFYKILTESSHKISRQPLIQPDIYMKIKQFMQKSTKQNLI